ncbi:MAG: peptidoglycan bridge formation glycyltransferase FemA/FemB family protein [Patescibacteria group bacterium]|nr:peptidoglycan bridge formation glycyltransferase FemA/FemB family protein [Patescibacteria group bacterium]
MEKKFLDFIQQNSPDGGFLQSEHWKSFQEAWGRKTYSLNIADDTGDPIIAANIIEHTLPVVGNYFYVPRGPVVQVKSEKLKVKSYSSKLKVFLDDLVDLAKRCKISWIRVEPNYEGDLEVIRENIPDGLKVKKSAVDMQPREILMMDISKDEEELLAGMKQKTRYNIRLAEKRGVRVSHNMEHITHNINKFLRLIKITAKRDKITAHPESYYRKMFETIPPEVLKMYVAEYEGKFICANLVLFFGKTATYLHGASDNIHRDAMAPYLLQWRQILDARKAGCEKYDFGGVKTHNMEHGTWNTSSWGGITKFKQGFAPHVAPVQFPGCCDIVLNPFKYNLYRIMQKLKRII